MAKGYIKLDRQIIEHWLWHPIKPNKFDERAAWIDLILSANFTDGEFVKFKKKYIVKRGQFFTSIDHLAERWNWSRTSVFHFLKTLEQDGMIYKDSDSIGTLLTIVNYDKFQDVQNAKQTTEQTTKKTTGRTTEQTTEQTRYKNDKECIKNDKRMNKNKPEIFEDY